MVQLHHIPFSFYGGKLYKLRIAQTVWECHPLSPQFYGERSLAWSRAEGCDPSGGGTSIAGSNPVVHPNLRKASMIEKMSKTGSDKPQLPKEISIEIRISALESELRYWKLRYELLEKYGNNSNRE